MQIDIASGGLMVGAQWHFGKVALDWWILGASYNSVHITASALTNLSDKLGDEWKANERDIESIKINNKGLNATVTSTGTVVD